jgi:hypothetical protein
MTMRNRLSMMVAALLLVSGGAMAQDKDQGGTAPPQDVAAAKAVSPEFAGTNQIEFGSRGTFYAADSDQAR